MIFFLEFLLLGLGVGLLGALVGAGGGFILTPLLLLLFPGERSEIITATSLSVVWMSALSGSIAYYRLGRIDLKTGAAYGLCAAPWIVLGVFTTSRVVRGPFDILLGVVLLALCISLLRSSPLENPNPQKELKGALVERRIVDRSGREYRYRFRFRIGIGLMTVAGFMSSFFGIGGGPVYVPLLIRVLRIPVYIATATSQFLLLIGTTVGVATHFLRGNLYQMGGAVPPLALGVIVGAQAGAALSGRLRSKTLTRIMSLLLVLVAVQLFHKGFSALLK